MKNQLLVILLLCCGLTFSHEGEDYDFVASFVSKEIDITTNSSLNLKIKAYHDVYINNVKPIHQPDGCVFEVLSVNQVIKEGDSLELPISFVINEGQASYYSKPFEIEVSYDSLEVISVEGYVYFTSYKTLELFSIEDYMESERSWEIPLDPEPSRVQIDKRLCSYV